MVEAVEAQIKIILEDAEVQVSRTQIMKHAKTIEGDLEDDDSKDVVDLKGIGMNIYATEKNFKVLQTYMDIADDIGKPTINRPIHKFVSNVH
jgi:hypothetical protein